MEYKWKLKGYYKVPAQVAGEELERISKENGDLTASGIVEASRPETAKLHSIFNWDDTDAAEKWREQQARRMTDNLVTVRVINETKQHEPVRAFVHIQGEYKPVDVVVKNKDYKDEMLESAYRELKAFEIKYRTLSQLAKLFDAIDEVLANGYGTESNG